MSVKVVVKGVGVKVTSVDLYDQGTYLYLTGQYRYTSHLLKLEQKVNNANVPQWLYTVSSLLVQEYWAKALADHLDKAFRKYITGELHMASTLDSTM